MYGICRRCRLWMALRYFGHTTCTGCFYQIKYPNG
jgi:hypothetical protein